MAETSGFFEAKVNEETNEYDRVYYASQFARYFSLFIGNGVFVGTSEQLLVESVSGMRIKVNPGWGFIEGYWYNNDKDLFIDVPVNTMAVARTDIVVLRKDEALRDTHIVYLEGETEIKRDGSYYDLLLATINVPVGSASVSNVNITDKRPDQKVCGFVKGLVDVITTDALFNQFTAQFNEWFLKMQGQLTGDPVGKLAELSMAVTEQVLTYENVIVNTSLWGSWVPEAGFEEYPFFAEVELEGVTSEHIPSVTLLPTDANDGNVAPTCTAEDGKVKLYAKEIPTDTLTIASIQLTKAYKGVQL